MKNFALSDVVCAVTLGVITASSAQASSVTYEFQVTLEGGFLLTDAPEIGI